MQGVKRKYLKRDFCSSERYFVADNAEEVRGLGKLNKFGFF